MTTYTPALDLTWQLAAYEAGRAQHEHIEPEHLLVALCELRGCTDRAFLDQHGYVGPAASLLRSEIASLTSCLLRAAIDADELVTAVRSRYRPGTVRMEDRQERTIHRAEMSRQLFAHAEQLATQAALPTTRATHLFAALLDRSGGGLLKLLRARDINIDALKEELLDRKASSTPVSIVPVTDLGETLQRFGKNLVQLAREGKIQPAVGRTEEMLRMVRTLSRATKNNPLLIGEPGVGKTAVVEGLAWRIAQGNAPAIMRDKQIVQISVTDLVAGTSYRGEFEKRLQALIVIVHGVERRRGAGRPCQEASTASVRKVSR